MAEEIEMQPELASRAASLPTIYQETDVRFWTQTHYKPGHKLDPNNPADQMMLPLYMQILHQVQEEDRTGHLVLTFLDPAVTQAINDAALAHDVATTHVEAAAAEPDPAAADQHVEAAAAAAAVQAVKLAEAAATQPPPVVAHHKVRHQARRAAQQIGAYSPKPGVIVFPPGHPATASDRVALQQASVRPPPLPTEFTGPPAKRPWFKYAMVGAAVLGGFGLAYAFAPRGSVGKRRR